MFISKSEMGPGSGRKLNQQRGNKVRVQGGSQEAGHAQKQDYCEIVFYQGIRF